MIIAQLIFYATVLSWFACLWKIFEKAGQPKWAGFIPVYNLLIMLRVIKKPWWWILILIIPGVNFLLIIVMHIELVRAFGLRTMPHYLAAAFVPPFSLAYIAFKPEIVYTGLPDYKKEKKSFSREWAEAIVFAVIAATIIRTFFIEAFTIPTPSMEKSLLVGDYLFVSKASYGARLPMTPIAFPLTHHTIPILNVQSFVEWQKLPYMRLPGWGEVERFDATVFNFPEGDTVITNFQNQSYYQLSRDRGRANIQNPNFRLPQMMDGRVVNAPMGDMLVRPVDKRENYIKRTIGLPGETIEVVDREIIIDGKPIVNPYGIQYTYQVYTKGALSSEVLKAKYGISISEQQKNEYRMRGWYELPLTEKEADIMKTMSTVDSVYLEMKRPQGDLHIYPNHPNFSWSEDNFGPLWIPEKGATIPLSLENLPLYRRVITAYEHNELEVNGDQIIINGAPVDSYTFEQNYYFMMGDNRHNSADSRFWGFVPHDHVVGKAVFVWFSKEAGGDIRWSRLFTRAK